MTIMAKNISIIVAVDSNMAIGRAGDQLAYISDDLKHFKALTSGHTVVMGRKTSDALPKGVLPNRRNIIVTRSNTFQREGAETVHSVDEALALIADGDEVFIMGGGEIYRQFMPVANTLYITEIDYKFNDVDTFFPRIDEAEWHVTEHSEWQCDPKTSLTYRFITYKRANVI